MTIYHLFRIRDTSTNSIRQITKGLRDHIIPAANGMDLTSYGLFNGHFGLASNECYWLTLGDRSGAALLPLIESLGWQIEDSMIMLPTVRPLTHGARDREGLYVFRWFRVKSRDVDTIAQLSEQAWVSFEGGFDTEIQGLFAEQHRSQPECRMLLLTWYKDFSVWQNSRTPPGPAMDRFVARHALTLETLPIATQLLGIP
jgi:hypothetical protein